jgi:hypothetical protein
MPRACARAGEREGDRREMAARFDFERALSALQSAVAAERDAAAEALAVHGRLGLNTVESLRALQAAAAAWPARDDGRDIACDLLWAAARTPRRVYVPVIEASFAGYGPRARVDALRLLLRIGDRHAAEVWLAAGARHGAELSAAGLDALARRAPPARRRLPRRPRAARARGLVAEVADDGLRPLADGELAPERLAGEAGPGAVGEDARARRWSACGSRTAPLGLGAPGRYLRSAARARRCSTCWAGCRARSAEAALRRGALRPGPAGQGLRGGLAGPPRGRRRPRVLSELAGDPELSGWLQSRLAGARSAGRRARAGRGLGRRSPTDREGATGLARGSHRPGAWRPGGPSPPGRPAADPPSPRPARGGAPTPSESPGESPGCRGRLRRGRWRVVAGATACSTGRRLNRAAPERTLGCRVVKRSVRPPSRRTGKRSERNEST